MTGDPTPLEKIRARLALAVGENAVFDGWTVKAVDTAAAQLGIDPAPARLAFPKAKIDMNRVRQAARQAQIAEFIESRPEGYDALLGERGVRLSGGQRQRIGIARALYKQASVLVFDEATSALDNATEQSVMEAIDGLARDLTVLLIAHRLTTVRHCDLIVELKDGLVAAVGSYGDLLDTSDSFRKLAKAEG